MKRFQFLPVFLCFIISGIFLVWAYYPLKRMNRIQSLRPIFLVPPTPSDGIDFKPDNLTPTAPYAEPLLLSDPQIVFGFPSKLRDGEADIVQLVFNTKDGENQSRSEDSYDLEFDIQGTPIEVSQDVIILVEARLDLNGMQVRPSELISEPLRSGGSGTFFWNIGPAQPGSYQGTAWLYLRTTDPSTGLETRQAITVQMIEIDVVDFHGLSTTWVQLFGWLGIGLGIILGIPLRNELINHR